MNIATVFHINIRDMKTNGKSSNGKNSKLNSPKRIPHNRASIYDRISTVITRAAGRPGAFIIAFAVIIVWGLCGPIFNYSDTWQLVINTSTTIITFLMVFVIQQSQNKDTLALQLKLNELIACQELASNRLIDVEDLTEEELMVLKKFYVRLSALAQQENDLHSSHSLDEAATFHTRKKRSVSPKS